MTELSQDDDKLHTCPDCAGIWIDGSDLNRVLLHANLPGVDSLGGRVMPDGPAGTCRNCLVDLTRLEARERHDPPFYEACQDCASVYVPNDGEPPADVAAAKVHLTAFFKRFISKKSK